MKLYGPNGVYQRGTGAAVPLLLPTSTQVIQRYAAIGGRLDPDMRRGVVTDNHPSLRANAFQTWRSNCARRRDQGQCRNGALQSARRISRRPPTLRRDAQPYRASHAKAFAFQFLDDVAGFANLARHLDAPKTTQATQRYLAHLRTARNVRLRNVRNSRAGKIDGASVSSRSVHHHTLSTLQGRDYGRLNRSRRAAPPKPNQFAANEWPSIVDRDRRSRDDRREAWFRMATCGEPPRKAFPD